MKKNNVVLIGMPGCGKSTVGVVLAKLLGFRFLDSDLLIQEREDSLLSELIARVGIDGFEAIENTVNSQITAKKTVIATGGSVVYGREAMAHLKDIALVVYIRLPFEEIEHRLGDLTKRGVAIRKGQRLIDLYNERCPLYEKYADITADGLDMNISEMALYIRDRVLTYFNEREGGQKDDKR